MNNNGDSLSYINDRKKHSSNLEKCNNCDYNKECLGVEKLYIDFFGDNEFIVDNKIYDLYNDLELNAIDIYIYEIILKDNLLNLNKESLFNIILEKMNLKSSFFANSLSINLLLSSYNEFEESLKLDINNSLNKLINIKFNCK